MPNRLQDSFFRALFDSPVHGIAVGDIGGQCIIEINRRLLDIIGCSREEIVGVPFKWRDVTPSEYHAADEEAMRQVMERGHSDPFEKEYVRPDGSRVPVRVSATVVENYPENIIIFVDDISAEKRARERERSIQRRLEIALSAADQGVWDWDLVTNEMIYSERAKEIYGFPANQPVTFEQVRDATHPEDYKVTSVQLQRSIDPAVRDRSSYEYRVIRPDGSIRWALAFGEAVFEGPPGAERAVRYAGTIQDITARKEAERHRELLIGELNHRVKNTLAIVQALAFQTLRKGNVDEEVSAAFAGRLQALAAAHDILTRERWEAANLRDIAAAVLHPHDDGGGRIELDGDATRLSPQTAVNFAMVMHELATNAVKHGALSNGHGRVRVAWQAADPAAQRLRFEWRESGGPPVIEPKRQGFGTRMIRRALGSEIRGSVALDFRPDGLECTIEAPLP